MQKTMKVTIEGEELTVATVKVGALEVIDLDGKKGRQFNIAFIAASLLSAGDQKHGTEVYVRSIPVFDAEGGDGPFDKLLRAANEVNGFKNPKPAQPGEGEPVAPAAG